MRRRDVSNRRLPDIADRVVRWSTACDRLGGRPVVAWHGWSADGRFVLFMKAGNGDENYNLFVVEPNNGEVRNLSAFCGDHNAPGCGPLGGAPGAIRRVDSVTPSYSAAQREKGGPKPPSPGVTSLLRSAHSRREPQNRVAVARIPPNVPPAGTVCGQVVTSNPHSSYARR